MVGRLAVAARRHDRQFLVAGRALKAPGQQQHRPGIGHRPLEQTVQGQLGHGDDIGLVGQFERQTAQFLRRPAHLGDGRLVLLSLHLRLQKAGVPAAVRDRRRLVHFQRAFTLRLPCRDRFLVVSHHPLGPPRPHLGKRSRQIEDKRQLRVGNADDLARRRAWSPRTRAPSTSVPFRLSRSRNVHWPFAAKTSA